ncbi:MAG: cupredoxin domain-containing protein [Chloroflexi bacterium]|nr:cupredoxin domain-containing protein [Chloroflexota bacterium]
MSIKRIILCLLCLTGLLLAACGKDAPAQTPLEIKLLAQDIKFDVKTLTAKVDQPVKLTYINQGSIDHAFKIEGIVDESKVKPGQTHLFEFTPTKVGQFKFVCAMPGHEPAGMVGLLIVEP